MVERERERKRVELSLREGVRVIRRGMPESEGNKEEGKERIKESEWKKMV